MNNEISRRRVLQVFGASAAGGIAGCMTSGIDDADEKQYDDVSYSELVLNPGEYSYDHITVDGYLQFDGLRTWYGSMSESDLPTYNFMGKHPEEHQDVYRFPVVEVDETPIQDTLDSEGLTSGETYSVRLKGEVEKLYTDHGFWSGAKNGRYVLKAHDVEPLSD